MKVSSALRTCRVSLRRPRGLGRLACGWAALLCLGAGVQAGELPRFREHVIATDLKLGYQLLAIDLTGDGRKDVVAVDEQATELAWYEHPTWQRHVLATGVPRPLNADGWDIEGDGCPELVLAYQLDSRAKQSVGNVT